MPGKMIIYYDGDCEVCGRIKERLQIIALADEFLFLDANSTKLPGGVSKTEALADVHVVDENVLYKGGDVIPRIARRLPRWRLIAPILAMRPFIWILRSSYRLLAEHRPFFGHFI